MRINNTVYQDFADKKNRQCWSLIAVTVSTCLPILLWLGTNTWNWRSNLMGVLCVQRYSTFFLICMNVYIIFFLIWVLAIKWIMEERPYETDHMIHMFFTECYQKLLNCIPVMLGHVHWVQRFLFSFLNSAHSGSFCNQNCDLNTLLCQTHFAFQRSAL